MTRTIKWVVIGIGMFVIVPVCVVGVLVTFVLLTSSKESKESYAAKEAEGREFGKTTDQAGCMKEGLARAKQIKPLDINQNADNQGFVGECLKSSRQIPGFCDGLPPWWKFDDDDWAFEQCDSIGMERVSCSGVFQAKLDACRGD